VNSKTECPECIELADWGVESYWELEAVIMIKGTSLSIPECNNRVIGRWLLDGRLEPLLDAVSRRIVLRPQILRLIGKMHDGSVSLAADELPPYLFQTISRDAGKPVIWAGEYIGPLDETILLEALAMGDVRPLAQVFRSGVHPNWPVLALYAEMHQVNRQTPFAFKSKRRSGGAGRHADPVVRFRRFLMAGYAEILKDRGLKHEDACRKAGELLGAGDNEEVSRAASKIFGRYFRPHLRENVKVNFVP
jgi:hypothetical protein